MELVEKGEHQRDRVLSDRQIFPQFSDQPDAGDVDLAESIGAGIPFRPHPAVRDPGVQVRRGKAGEQLPKLVGSDHGAAPPLSRPLSRPMSRRGSKPGSGRPRRREGLNSSSTGPITTLRVTYSSPALSAPCAGTPLPRRRSTRPVSDPSGTRSVTAPLGVGTGILAPSTASATVTGTSTWMSLPSRRKKG